MLMIFLYLGLIMKILTGFEVVFNYPSVVSKSIIRNSPGSLHENYGTYEIKCNNCNDNELENSEEISKKKIKVSKIHGFQKNQQNKDRF